MKAKETSLILYLNLLVLEFLIGTNQRLEISQKILIGESLKKWANDYIKTA